MKKLLNEYSLSVFGTICLLVALGSIIYIRPGVDTAIAAAHQQRQLAQTEQQIDAADAAIADATLEFDAANAGVTVLNKMVNPFLAMGVFSLFLVALRGPQTHIWDKLFENSQALAIVIGCVALGIFISVSV